MGEKRAEHGRIKRTSERLGRGLIFALILLLAWELAFRSGRWSRYVLPGPGKVADALWTMVVNGSLFVSMAVSLRRVLTGYLIAFVLAFLLGAAAAARPRWNDYYGPYLEFMRNVPPLSLIALLILWFGIGETSKIIIIVLASFFPMFLNIRKGFTSCDKKLLEVGQVCGFSYFRQFSRIILPGAVPDILVGMRIGLGYSWRAIIGAEMIAASSGLGYLILDAQQMSRSDKVIVGIFAIGLIGIACDKVFGLLVAWVTHGGADSENI